MFFKSRVTFLFFCNIILVDDFFKEDYMTYQKFITDPMPEYSKGEEIFNYVSHIAGGAIGIFLFLVQFILV